MNPSPPRPFFGAACRYRDFRPQLPPEVAEFLARLTPASATRRLLDVGTGTGGVILALAPYFDDLIGVDPESEMLEIAAAMLRPLVRERKVIRLFASAIEEWTLPEGWEASLVVFCRSFHWVEQDETLRRLSSMTTHNGAVALISDGALLNADSGWRKSAAELVTEFIGEPKRLWMAKNPARRRDWGDVLRASPFSVVRRASFAERRIWTVERVIGYIYSTSTSRRDLFGARAQQFESELNRRLAAFGVDGGLIEEAIWEVILGRKP